MAELKAPAVAVTWSLIAVAIVAYLAQSSNSVDCTRGKLFTCGRKFSSEDWTDAEWKKRGKDALEEIRKRDSLGGVYYDTKHWLEVQVGIPSEADCTKKMTIDLIKMRSMDKKFKKFHIILDKYFKLYSAKCDLEEKYSRVIHELRQISHDHWKSDIYTTLHKYLNSRFWSTDTAVKLMSVAMDISELDSITANCTDEYIIHKVLKRSIKRGSDDIMDVYDRFYLNKCGFEERFKRAIDNLKLISSKDWDSVGRYSTLFSYFKENYSKHGWNHYEAARLISAIREISEPESINGELDCTEKRVAHVAEMFVKTYVYAELYDFLGSYYAFYLKRCGFEDHFKKAIENSEKLLHNHKSLDKYETLSGYLMSDPHLPGMVIPLLSLIRAISDMDNNSGQINCAERHAMEMLQLYGKSLNYVDLRKFVGNYLKFYLDKCNVENYSRDTIDKINKFYSKLN